MRATSSRQRLPPATTTASLKAGDARAGFARDDRGPVARLARKPATENRALQRFWRAAQAPARHALEEGEGGMLDIPGVINFGHTDDGTTSTSDSALRERGIGSPGPRPLRRSRATNLGVPSRRVV